MRKLILLVSIIAFASLVPVVASAEEGSELEISGNVTSVTGWTKARTSGTVPARGGSLADNLAGLGAAGTDTFGFWIDQAEVDLAKSFGENIRIRADLDFTPVGPGKGGVFGTIGDVGVEQAYTTANIPAGNGAELLVGRFNSGIGSDPVDRNELKTISFGTIHRVLLPHNMTGARLGYDFSDTTRGELFVVNDLQDSAPGTTSNHPSGGFNLVYAWGEEGNQNWVKFTGAGGSETAANKSPSFLGDLATGWAVSDAFSVGLEAIFRSDFAVGPDAQAFGGQLSGTYGFSDVWDGTLRYGFIQDDADASGVALTNENTAAPGLGLGAAKGQQHEITLATGYAITDGARFAFEGRVDLAKVTGGTMGMGFGVAGMFAYSF